MWYFVENGLQKGPVKLEKIRSLIAQEIITPTTLVWKRGMDDWLVASETELKDLLPEDMPPPIPVDSPQPIRKTSFNSGLTICVALLGSFLFLLHIHYQKFSNLQSDNLKLRNQLQQCNLK